MKLNKGKCIFITEKLNFFGIEISSKGISPDKNKIKAINPPLPPSNISELRSLLGLCTHVSRFIDNYSEKTAVLRELLQKNKKFSWDRKYIRAFQKLKEELSSNTVLAFYDPNKDLQLVTDGSSHEVGGVLLQKDNNDALKSICYIRRALTAVEMKYSITEKKALSLVWCIEKLRLYLYGKRFDFVVEHQPLKYIFSANYMGMILMLYIRKDQQTSQTIYPENVK